MKFKHEKKTRFHQVFHEKIVNNFLNSEQKIIYAKKRANNFLNNAELENNFMQNRRNCLYRKQ